MILVVYNPTSGFGLKFPNLLGTIKAYLKKRGHEVAWIETEADNSIKLELALKNNYERVIVSGGDGTVRQVADSLIRNKNQSPLAIIPMGTMNVIALSLNIPLTIKRALRHALKHDARSFDVGVVNDSKYFFIACGIGYDAECIDATKRGIKKWLGPLSYPIIAFSKAFNHQKIHGTLTTDAGEEKITASTLMAFNIKTLVKHHPFLRLRPHAGVVDVMIADYISPWNAWRLAWYMFWNKTSLTPPLRLFTSTSLRFQSDEEITYEMDGDLFKAKDISIKIMPNALQLICEK